MWQREHEGLGVDSGLKRNQEPQKQEADLTQTIIEGDGVYTLNARTSVNGQVEKGLLTPPTPQKL